MNISRPFHPPPGHDDAAHVGHPHLRRHGLPPPSGQRPPERRFPDHPGLRRSARRQPRDHGRSVATPLEKQFSTIDGLDSMTSTNILGITPDHPPVLPEPEPRRRRPGRPVGHLPRPAPASPCRCPPRRPTRRSTRPCTPILFIVLTSPTLPLSTLDDYAETMMAQRISMVDGVAQVMVYGSQIYAVRVQLDPDALASRRDRARPGRPGHPSAGTPTCPTGDPLRARAGLHRAVERPALQRRRLPRAHRDLPQRLARPAEGRRPRPRQRPERQGRGLVFQ